MPAIDFSIAGICDGIVGGYPKPPSPPVEVNGEPLLGGLASHDHDDSIVTALHPCVSAVAGGRGLGHYAQFHPPQHGYISSGEAIYFYTASGLFQVPNVNFGRRAVDKPVQFLIR